MSQHRMLRRSPNDFICIDLIQSGSTITLFSPIDSVTNAQVGKFLDEIDKYIQTKTTLPSIFVIDLSHHLILESYLHFVFDFCAKYTNTSICLDLSNSIDVCESEMIQKIASLQNVRSLYVDLISDEQQTKKFSNEFCAKCALNRHPELYSSQKELISLKFGEMKASSLLKSKDLFIYPKIDFEKELLMLENLSNQNAVGIEERLRILLYVFRSEACRPILSQIAPIYPEIYEFMSGRIIKIQHKILCEILKEMKKYLPKDESDDD